MDSVEMDAANTLRGLRGDEYTKTPEKSKEPWMTCPVALWNLHVADAARLCSSAGHMDLRSALDAAMEARPNV